MEGVGPVYCVKCQMWLRDREQWDDHVIGKKHKMEAWRRFVRELLRRAWVAEWARAVRVAGRGRDAAALHDAAA